MTGYEDLKIPQEQKYPTQTSKYTVRFSYILFTHLCPVKLSQNVIVPSDPQVITQVWGTPFAFVPTHTKASNPNPRRRLHRRLAWSSQSPLFRHRKASRVHHCSCLPPPPPMTGALSWPRTLTKRAACRGVSSSRPARRGRTNEHTGRFAPFSS